MFSSKWWRLMDDFIKKYMSTKNINTFMLKKHFFLH